MFRKLEKAAARLLFPRPIRIHWIKRSPSSWLAQEFSGTFIRPDVTPLDRKIEEIAAATNALGSRPLWAGYESTQPAGQVRRSDEVRTSRLIGNFFASLTRRRAPDVIVEFGTAFGVSGMYWLAGLEASQRGELLTFEPNNVWADIARQNLSRISSRFTLECGTFEENIDRHLSGGRRIDIAFIDAIHTREFVVPQLDLVVERSSDRSLILIDDIEFSDDMKRCWMEIAEDGRFLASATLGSRVGILEIAGTQHARSGLGTGSRSAHEAGRPGKHGHGDPGHCAGTASDSIGAV